jgi:hypothetical protein
MYMLLWTLLLSVLLCGPVLVVCVLLAAASSVLLLGWSECTLRSKRLLSRLVEPP